MSRTALRARAVEVTRLLAELYPEATCALIHRGPYQLLVATILSAQCTDVRVNTVTPGLFARWPDAPALASADVEEVQEVIHSTGFYRNKAKNLVAMAKQVVERHGGGIPDTMGELAALPGVARKTANVVLGTAFGLNEGVVVDTHVHRIAHRLGLARHHDPNKVERALMDLLPREGWSDFSHRMILHGRRVCIARKPRCGDCNLREACPARQDVKNPRRLLNKKAMTTPRKRRPRRAKA